MLLELQSSVVECLIFYADTSLACFPATYMRDMRYEYSSKVKFVFKIFTSGLL